MDSKFVFVCIPKTQCHASSVIAMLIATIMEAVMSYMHAYCSSISRQLLYNYCAQDFAM